MIRTASLLSMALLGATSAAAADNRIRTVVYDPNQVVRLVGRSGIQSTIEFAADETIENVAVGDSAAWQITPNRRARLLFLKPLVQSSRTNMTVVTSRRTYMFDLVTGPKDSVPLYALKFFHPAGRAMSPRPAAVAAAAPARSPAPVPAAAITPDRLYFGWKMKGAERLLPRRVFDDGRSLYLVWPREAGIPAILTVNAEGKEGAVNYRTSGEYIVVDEVPSNVLLRIGKKSASLRRLTPATAPAGGPARPAPVPSRPAEPDRALPTHSVAQTAAPADRGRALAAAAVARPVAPVIPAGAPADPAERKLLLGHIAAQIADGEADSDKLAGSGTAR